MIEKAQLMAKYPTLHDVIAVSKTQPIEAIQTAMTYGYTSFGENKAQELKEKASLGLEVTWHFIGHLQTNKVKEVVKYASWIHSVDSLRLLREIQKECEKQTKLMTILIQVDLTHEPTKSGCLVEDLNELIEAALRHPFCTLKGLMVMGPHCSDENEIEAIFTEAESLFLKTQKVYPQLSELSMGMSQDYALALKHSSTLIRIGTLLFNERKKHA